MSDCISPAWDKEGKYLCFLASTNYGLNVAWLDMSSVRRPLEYGVYMAVLSSEDPSPLAPKSDDEDLDQRIIALDIPVKAYRTIESGDTGKIYMAALDMQAYPRTSYELHEYNLKDREMKLVKKGIQWYTLSKDGKKILYRAVSNLHIEDAKPALKGEGMLSLANIKTEIDPKLEWKQIFQESIRYQRDFFYVENTHGLDLK